LPDSERHKILLVEPPWPTTNQAFEPIEMMLRKRVFELHWVQSEPLSNHSVHGIGVAHPTNP
jgi:hypothetical protein